MIKLIKFCAVCLFLGAFCLSAHSEPLRVLVPSFSGPSSLSKKIRTTVYLELVKSFQRFGTPEKGAWILYGQDDMNEPSHDAAINASIWPSVRADVVIWGQVLEYTGNIAVQLYLTVTPIIEERKVRSETWSIYAENVRGTTFDYTIGTPGLFYEFEPFVLSENNIIDYESPQDIPILNKRKNGKAIGNIEDVIWFLDIYKDAVRVKSGELTGWVKSADIGSTGSEVIPFAQGVIRLMRGDYHGAKLSFSDVLNNKNIPQMLRIHSLIYKGLAKEKLGSSGIPNFLKAFNLNRLDNSSASYLLMGRMSNVVRATKSSSPRDLNTALMLLQKDLNNIIPLFTEEDTLIRAILAYLEK